MRSLDESFQRMISKRYGVDFGEIKQSKSIFESLNDCDTLDNANDNLTESELGDLANKGLTKIGFGKTYEVVNQHGPHQFKTKEEAINFGKQHGGKVYEISNKEVRTLKKSKDDKLDKLANRINALNNMADNQQKSDIYKAMSNVKAERKLIDEFATKSDDIDYTIPKNYTGKESLHEAISKNYIFKNGVEAREFFDQLYKRGRKEFSSDEDVEKCKKAYYEVVKLLNVSAEAGVDAMVKAYDALSNDNDSQKTINKLTRLALTNGAQADEIAKSYDESFAKLKAKNESLRSIRRNINRK